MSEVFLDIVLFIKLLPQKGSEPNFVLGVPKLKSGILTSRTRNKNRRHLKDILYIYHRK